VPAGDRSAAGTGDAAGTEGTAVVVVGGLDDELEHPARPKTEADRTTSDHERRRDIERVPFQG
jgi:hypothetical protein